MTGGDDRDPLDRPLKIQGAGSSAASQAPKRFYKEAGVATSLADLYRIHLDGRPVRTPGKRIVELPARGLAEALAAEWAAQGERIDPTSMPLMRLVNSALDGVAGNEAKVAADIVAFAGIDLTCYRADSPESLVRRQATHWDPILAWAGQQLGGRFVTAVGIVHVAQDERLLAQLATRLDSLDPMALAALHVMTTISGSAITAWATAEGHVTTAHAWIAAHVDEDWQIEKWGEDAEAAARRQNRWRDFEAAARLVAHIRAQIP